MSISFKPEEEQWISSDPDMDRKYSPILRAQVFNRSYIANFFPLYAEYTGQFITYARLYYDIESPFQTIRNKNIRHKEAMQRAGLPDKFFDEIAAERNRMLVEMGYEIALNNSDHRVMEWVSMMKAFHENSAILNEDISSLDIESKLKAQTLRQRISDGLSKQRKDLENLEKELFGANHGVKEVAKEKYKDMRQMSKPSEMMKLDADEVFNIGVGYDKPIPTRSQIIGHEEED